MKKIILLALIAITLLPTTVSAEDNDNQEFHAKAGLDLVANICGVVRIWLTSAFSRH